MEKKINQTLIKAANELIATAEKPQYLLQFATDMLALCHYYFVDKHIGEKENNAHFMLLCLIRDIVMPWYEGGDNVANKVAEGIEEYYKFGGLESHERVLNTILLVIGESESDYNSSLVYVQALHRLSINLCLYETEKEKEKELF